MTTLSVVEGDITRIEADVLIAFINSEQMWFGGIDAAIQRVAGNRFHAQAAAHCVLNDGDSILALNTGSHAGKFEDVIFVVDDGKTPLSTLIHHGLEMAQDNSLKNIVLPTFRTGEMANSFELRDEALRELANTVHEFTNSETFQEITIVVSDNPADAALLKRILRAKG